MFEKNEIEIKKVQQIMFKTSFHLGVMKNNFFFLLINGDLIGNISSYEFSVFLHGRNRISAYVNFLSFF